MVQRKFLFPNDRRHNDAIEPKRIKISEGYRRCNLMSLRIQASPELLKFAYDAGLGEKNAMGFGCVDLMNCSQHTENLTADERP